MISLKVDYQNAGVDRALSRLTRLLRDTTPLHRQIGGDMLAEAERAFDQQRSPGGRRWAALAESTVADRQRQGYGGTGPMLRRTGRLVSSIQVNVDRRGVSVGTNVDYAQFLQRGTRLMPARAFLGFSPGLRRSISQRTRRGALNAFLGRPLGR